MKPVGLLGTASGIIFNMTDCLKETNFHSPPHAFEVHPAFESACLGFDENGTPFSSLYGDVYHSAAGGPAQATAVFLAGNALPERWREKAHFVVLETGFGLGLNFLTTWKAWREDARACRKLCYLSLEKHPLTANELARVQAGWPEFRSLSECLLRQWPPSEPGVHTLELEPGLTLSLGFGEAIALLPCLESQADAFYLDGFSPSRNPELWTPELFHELAQHAASNATLATWCVAGSVRTGLAAAGFSVKKHPGFGGKRHRLAGDYVIFNNDMEKNLNVSEPL